MKSIIHVNKQHIAMNAKNGTDLPVYTIKQKGKTKYAREVEILGHCKLVYDKRQLSCGARAWIETESDVILLGETTFKEAREKSKT